MLKTVRDMLFGALVIAAIGAAFATVGTPPLPGSNFALPDSLWLNGLAGGLNSTFQSGISAAGTTQATATALASGIKIVEVDTVAASTGVSLPPCLPPVEINLYNNGANTLTLYPAVANNPVTAAQDTINNSTSFTIATHVSAILFCGKNGVWAAK
jgi:hypothetical protein